MLVNVCVCLCVCMRVCTCNTGGKWEHIGKNTDLAPLQTPVLQVWGQHLLTRKGGRHLSLSVVGRQEGLFPPAFHTLAEIKALTLLFRKDHLLLFQITLLGSPPTHFQMAVRAFLAVPHKYLPERTSWKYDFLPHYNFSDALTPALTPNRLDMSHVDMCVCVVRLMV